MLPARRPKERKVREPKVSRECKPHRKWVCGFACSMCGHFGTEANPIVPAHVRLGTTGGMGLKPADRWVVSLCDECHKLQHNMGERSFWQQKGIDPQILADEFARRSPHWPRLKDMP